MLNFGQKVNLLVALAGCGKMKGIKFRVASKDASKLWKAVKEMKRITEVK